MLLKKLKSDLIISMKEKNVLKKEVLTLVIGNYQLQEKELKKELTEIEGLNILSKEIKQLEESLSYAKMANKENLIKEYENKIQYLKEYLPTMMSESEIRIFISEKIKELSLDTSNIGILMKNIKPLLNGKADMKIVSQIIKEFI